MSSLGGSSSTLVLGSKDILMESFVVILRCFLLGYVPIVFDALETRASDVMRDAAAVARFVQMGKEV